MTPQPPPIRPADDIVQLPCRDVLGRPRQVTVIIRGPDLILHTPPGDVAVLDTDSTAQLGRAIAAATRPH